MEENIMRKIDLHYGTHNYSIERTVERKKAPRKILFSYGSI